MGKKDLSYQQIKNELDEAKAIISALRGEEVDTIISKDNILVVRLKEAEQLLKKEKNHLHKLYNSISDAIITMRMPEKTIDRVNNSAERTFREKY
jgi:PAS domain-containing protein